MSENRKNVNLFFTGGFDSTFRLLELVNNVNIEQIQPIYISADIDHQDQNAQVGKRRSQEKEILTINRIIAKLNSQKVNKLKIIEDEPKYSLLLALTMRYLASKNIVRRPKCQIGAIAQYTIENKIIGEVAIIETDFMRKSLSPYIVKDGDAKKLIDDIDKIRPSFWIFKNLRFPLIYKSKSDIFEIAKKNDWLHILEETWSCWYPQKNGTPCLKCPMCRNRII